MFEKDKLILLNFEGKQKSLTLPKTFTNLEQNFLNLFQKNKDSNYIFYYEDENKDNICLEDYLYPDFVSNIKQNNQEIFVIEDKDDNENKDDNEDNIENTPLNNIESCLSLLKKEIEEEEKIITSNIGNEDNKNKDKELIEKMKTIEEKLQKENEENKILKEENKKLNEENNILKEENKKLNEENKILKEENKKLNKENKILKEENKNIKIDLENKIKELKKNYKKMGELKFEKEKNETINRENENLTKEIENNKILISNLEEKLKANKLEFRQIKNSNMNDDEKSSSLPNKTEEEKKELYNSNLSYISNKEIKNEKYKIINKLFDEKIKKNKKLRINKENLIEENNEIKKNYFIKYYKIKEFRKEKELDEEQISDERLIEIMKKSDGDFEKAFLALFP